ncbi:glycosyltransferase [Arsenicicoccus piscis]|uniref:glycosyltransferase n=1 Tax=Arsenicicoccus piscis TaxID=673954 RepID=UPI0024E04652|nr:glycosyltransferase [Arsenicicoccus piscis]
MRIAFLSWRDLTHPEGGGAERYAQTVCAGLAARGHDVTLLCADHGRAPARSASTATASFARGAAPRSTRDR